jgi:hypothetical protein
MPTFGRQLRVKNISLELKEMSNLGSFSPEAYRAYKYGVENPSNFMGIAPAFEKEPGRNPDSFFMGEDDEINEDDYDTDYENEDFEPNGGMAMTQLRSMQDNIETILEMIGPYSNLDPWMAAKLAEAEHGMTAIADALQYRD